MKRGDARGDRETKTVVRIGRRAGCPMNPQSDRISAEQLDDDRRDTVGFESGRTAKERERFGDAAGIDTDLTSSGLEVAGDFDGTQADVLAQTRDQIVHADDEAAKLDRTDELHRRTRDRLDVLDAFFQACQKCLDLLVAGIDGAFEKLEEVV